jgi:hypothetical protein
MKRTVLLTSVLLLMTVAQQTAWADDGVDLDKYIAATVDNPYDVSGMLKNPTGTENYGWSRNANDAAAGYNKHNTEFDSSVYAGKGIESWYWSPVTNADLIWQTVDGLLPGTYVVSAYVVGQIYNDTSKKGQYGGGLWLMANDERVAITQNKWQRLSVTCTVKAGEQLKIGITADGTNLNDWTSIAGVTVECQGMGEPEKVALSEDFDLTCVRGYSYADVLLKRNVAADGYTVLCLPFPVDSTTTAAYFSEVGEVTAVAQHGNDYVVTTTPVKSIERGKTYVVKATDGNRSTYSFDKVVVDMTADTSASVDGVVLQGNFRQRDGMTGIYIMQTDGSTFHKRASVSSVKAYSGWIELP